MKKLLSFVLILTIVMSLFTGLTVTASAEENTSSAQTEELTETTTKTLENGKTYYITKDLTINGDRSSKNGLVVPANATVTLNIPLGLTLTVYGKHGYTTTGGGAAILLPETATLIVVGSGKLVAIGGNAGNGSKGGNGSRSYVSDNTNGVLDYEIYQAGAGGTGGNGGGGAGAGIGTNGGTGGNGSGSGGSYWRDDDIRHYSRNGYGGSSGASGKDALASGTLIIANTIDVTEVAGGSAGSAGAKGLAGATGYDGDDGDARGIAGGAGGGGGGGGLKGAAVGTGGGGGGQGGGGGSAGYIWSGRYVGGGGGGGGQGNGTSYGGAYGSDGVIEENDCDNTRVNSVTVTRWASSGSNGSLTSCGSGGSGAIMKIRSDIGIVSEGTAGNGGRGGSSGKAATEYSPDDDSDKYILLAGGLTGNGDGSGGGGGFDYTDEEQTVEFTLNTIYWTNSETGQPCSNDSFYYVLYDKEGNQVKTGGLTLDSDGNTSFDLPEGLDAGEYTLKVGSTESNQELITVGGFEIKPETVENEDVVVNFDDFSNIEVDPPVYNGTDITPDVTITYDGKTLVENEDYKVTYENNQNAGKATMTIEFIGNYTGIYTKEFEIAKCDPTLTVTDNNTSVYDRLPVTVGTSDGDVQYSYSGNGDITIKWYADLNGEKGTELSSAPTDAGTYWIGISAAEASNYNAVEEVVQKLVIEPYALKDSDVSVVSTQFNYDKTEHTLNITVKHGQTVLTIDTEYTLSGHKGTDANSYTALISGKGNYADTVEIIWNIEKVNPVLTESPVASAITYGETLADSTLSGGIMKYGDTVVSGTFAWETSTIAPAVADSDTTAYTVVFYPNDNVNFNEATTTVTLTVNKATPVLTESPVASSIIYGETLADSTISGGTVKYGDTMVSGTFTWETATIAPAVIDSDTTAYTIIFSPDDSDNYNGFTATITLTVNKATPVLTESPVASAITYGETLADSTLSGGIMKHGDTVVSGTFAWETSTIAPAVADSDTTAYTVVFYPNDNVNFNEATITVTLTVNKAPQPAPDGITKTDETIMEKNDGIISGLNDTMEYRFEDGEWIGINGTSIENLPDGEYEFRYKENDNYLPGDVTKVTIENGRYLIVEFETNGGNDIEAFDNAIYNGFAVEPEEPTLLHYNFAGWFKDEDLSQTWNFDLDTVTTDLTLYAKWTFESVYTVEGTVEMDGPVEGATVELKRGDEVISATVTNSDGSYTLNNVPAGEYNIVITTKDGKEITELITVKRGEISGTDITMPVGAVSSSVEVLKNEDAIHDFANIAGTLVDGLNDIAEAQTPADGEHITIQMVVVPKADVTDKEDHPDNKEQLAIKDKASGQLLEYFDLELTKTVSGGAPIDIGDSNVKILKIVIPFNTSEAVNIVVYRYHDGVAAALKRNPDANEEGYVVGTDCVIIYAKSFSPYAIGYILPNIPESSVTPPSVENGNITVNTGSAAVGSTATITVTPDEGYELSDLIVKDKDGNEIEVTKMSDGTYTFKMPDGKVTIDAKFAPVSDDSPCAKDETCPLYGYTDVDMQAWYHDGVHYCIENGLMNGVGNNQFAPDSITTRAQIVTILWRMEGSPMVEDTENFNDVYDYDWYSNSVRWASANGIVVGYEGNFNPNDTITREQMATILWRYAKYKGLDVSVGKDINIQIYTDAEKVSSWAVEAMQWACSSGIIQGMADCLEPQHNAIRSQSATMIYRFCTEIKK